MRRLSRANPGHETDFLGVWPSAHASPRIQSAGEEMFSAKEEQEGGDDPPRGLGRWCKVVKTEKRGGSKNLVNRCRFNRAGKGCEQLPRLNSCALLADCPGGSATDMDLCAATQVVDTPIECELEENLEQRPNIDPLDSIATPME